MLTPGEESYSLAAELISRGEVVAIPTETVYGLAANAYDSCAVEKIFSAKGRPQDNPLIVHIAHIEDVSELVCEFPESAQRLAAAYWPGPLTIILKKSDKVCDAVTCGMDTLALRMPSHSVARAVIERAGVPLAAPSANLSGSPSPTSAAHVLADMDGRIPLIIDGGECDFGVESTVITLAGEMPVLLRPGAVTVPMLEAVLGEIEISSAVLAELREGERAESPGMKYRHYSPSAKVIIFDGTLQEMRQYLFSLDSLDGVCALCFDDDADILPVLRINYGMSDDSISQSQHLFAALREVDNTGAKVAYARCPSSEGVGLAVMNRLLRAAGFERVSLK